MDQENSLRQRACDAVAAQRMPARRPLRTWAGMGSGRACRVCESAIRDDEVELEVEFVADARALVTDDCRVHAACFEAWEALVSSATR